MAADRPSEFTRLSKLEQGFALRRYNRWKEILKQNEELTEDQRLQALNVANVSVAQLWLAVASPIGFAAACVWSFRDNQIQVGIATALTVLAIVPLIFMSIRWRQAHQYWAGIVRLPPT